MQNGYKSERNVGCIVATVFAAPVLVLSIFGGAMGGFGCEAAPRPCTPAYGRFWLGLVAIIACAFALAWLVNAAMRRFGGGD